MDFSQLVSTLATPLQVCLFPLFGQSWNWEKHFFLCIGIVAKYYGVLVNFSLGMLFALLAVSYIIFFLKDSSLIRDKRLQREIEEEIQDLELHKKFEGNLNLHTWTQIATSLLYVNHTSKAHVKPDNIP